MQLSNFINVFLARHVSGTYAHHQEHMVFSTEFLDGGGLESRCLGRVCVRCGWCRASHGTIRAVAPKENKKYG